MICSEETLHRLDATRYSNENEKFTLPNSLEVMLLIMEKQNFHWLNKDSSF